MNGVIEEFARPLYCPIQMACYRQTMLAQEHHILGVTTDNMITARTSAATPNTNALDVPCVQVWSGGVCAAAFPPAEGGLEDASQGCHRQRQCRC